jgi:hypothetical protein
VALQSPPSRFIWHLQLPSPNEANPGQISAVMPSEFWILFSDLYTRHTAIEPETIFNLIEKEIKTQNICV